MRKLSIITNNLFDGIKELEKKTFRTSSEIMNERTHAIKASQYLNQGSFYTANFGMYTIEFGEPILYFGGKNFNPILNNINDASKQIIEQGYYQVSEKEEKEIIKLSKQGKILKVILSELKSKKYNNKIDHLDIDFNINSNNKLCYKLNPSQRKLVERIFGSGENFKENMKLGCFINNHIFCSKNFNIALYTLNSNYIKNIYSWANQHSVACACSLRIGPYNSCFNIGQTEPSIELLLRGRLKK